MKVLLQRVARAAVTVGDRQIGTIGPGLLVLVCGEPGDSDATVAFMARKTAAMRIFNDDDGKMNRSLRDIGGVALVVSQFTLAADWRKGNRPGFSRAAPPAQGRDLYDGFCQALRDEGVPVETGAFGAAMTVESINDGPVTIPMDSGPQ